MYYYLGLNAKWRGMCSCGLNKEEKFTGSRVHKRSRKSTYTLHPQPAVEKRLWIYCRHLSNSHLSSATIISYSLNPSPTRPLSRVHTLRQICPTAVQGIYARSTYRRTSRIDLQNFIIAARPNNVCVFIHNKVPIKMVVIKV